MINNIRDISIFTWLICFIILLLSFYPVNIKQASNKIRSKKVEIKWIKAENLGSEDSVSEQFNNVHGIMVLPGFGDRGIKGKIEAAKFAREFKIPYFGICLGLQIAVIEFAKNVCGIQNASSSEFEDTESSIID